MRRSQRGRCHGRGNHSSRWSRLRFRSRRDRRRRGRLGDHAIGRSSRRTRRHVQHRWHRALRPQSRRDPGVVRPHRLGQSQRNLLCHALLAPPPAAVERGERTRRSHHQHRVDVGTHGCTLERGLLREQGRSGQSDPGPRIRVPRQGRACERHRSGWNQHQHRALFHEPARGRRLQVDVEDHDADGSGRTRRNRQHVPVHRVRRGALHDRIDRRHGRRHHVRRGKS